MSCPWRWSASCLAPFGLGILGQDYSTNGTVLLRLLLLSAIPQVVIGIALSAARVRRDNRLILAVYAAQALGVFGGTVLTIDRCGAYRSRPGWLVTQTTVALVLRLDQAYGDRAGGTSSWERSGWPAGSSPSCGSERNRRQARKLVASALSAWDWRSSSTDYRLLTSDSDSLIVSVARTTRAIRAQDRHDRRSLART